jgi:hypothetical protein
MFTYICLYYNYLLGQVPHIFIRYGELTPHVNGTPQGGLFWCHAALWSGKLWCHGAPPSPSGECRAHVHRVWSDVERVDKPWGELLLTPFTPVCSPRCWRCLRLLKQTNV